MKAREYRVQLNLSGLEFPAIKGLGSQVDFTKTDPPTIINNKVILRITKKLLITETYSKKEHEILTAESVYEIPVNMISSSEDIYLFYIDSYNGISEAYEFAKKNVPLPDIHFLTPPIETFLKEIDDTLNLIDSLN